MNAEEKKEILKKLVMSEEDTLKKFEILIDKSRKLFAIDGKTGNIVFENNNLTNPEKIILYLIGRYFAKEIGISQKLKFTAKELSEELNIRITTIGSPLIKLSEGGYIAQDGNEYYVNHYKIEDILDSLILKGINPPMEVAPGLKLDSSIKNVKKDGKITKKPKKVPPKKTSIDLSDIKPTTNPSGIADLASDLEVSEDILKSIFEFEEKEIHLLKKNHFDNDSDENFNNSVIFITAFYYYFDQREISGRLLIKHLKEANIGIGSHFKRDMSRDGRRSYILVKGANYKITETGIKLGIKFIKEMAAK